MPGRAQRVDDGVRDGGGRRIAPGLARALDAERVVRDGVTVWSSSYDGRPEACGSA